MTAWVHEDAGNLPHVNSVKNHLQYGDGAFFAGGFAKHLFEGKAPRDLDVFFESRDHFERFRDHMLEDGWETTFTRDNATGVSDGNVNIDLVTRVFGTPEEIIGNFDFTVTKFALYRNGEAFEAVFHPAFFEHFALRRLVIDDRLVAPISTFQRMGKYARYGYEMCRESKVRLLMSIRDWNPTPPEGGIFDAPPQEHDVLESALSRGLYEGVD